MEKVEISESISLQDIIGDIVKYGVLIHGDHYDLQKKSVHMRVRVNTYDDYMMSDNDSRFVIEGTTGVLHARDFTNVHPFVHAQFNHLEEVKLENFTRHNNANDLLRARVCDVVTPKLRVLLSKMVKLTEEIGSPVTFEIRIYPDDIHLLPQVLDYNV